MPANELRTCPACGGRVTRRLTNVPVRVRTRESVTIRRRVSRCADCGESFLAPGEFDAFRRAAADVVRAREQLLAPEEIRAIREGLGLSQAALERLLRLGPKTLGRWERGTSFQSSSVDTLLRVLRAVPQARAFLVGLARADAGGSALTSR